MRAYVMSHPGGPEVLEFREVPDPKPKKNWVLIQVNKDCQDRVSQKI